MADDVYSIRIDLKPIGQEIVQKPVSQISKMTADAKTYSQNMMIAAADMKEAAIIRSKTPAGGSQLGLGAAYLGGRFGSRQRLRQQEPPIKIRSPQNFNDIKPGIIHGIKDIKLMPPANPSPSLRLRSGNIRRSAQRTGTFEVAPVALPSRPPKVSNPKIFEVAPVALPSRPPKVSNPKFSEIGQVAPVAPMSIAGMGKQIGSEVGFLNIVKGVVNGGGGAASGAHILKSLFSKGRAKEGMQLFDMLGSGGLSSLKNIDALHLLRQKNPLKADAYLRALQAANVTDYARQTTKDTIDTALKAKQAAQQNEMILKTINRTGGY